LVSDKAVDLLVCRCSCRLAAIVCCLYLLSTSMVGY